MAEPKDPENKSILVSQVGFKITAIGGNATDVIIYPLQGNVQEDPPYFDILIQGESTGIEPIKYTFQVLSTKEDEKGYPLRFNIVSTEAEGDVTIYVTKFY